MPCEDVPRKASVILDTFPGKTHCSAHHEASVILDTPGEVPCSAHHEASVILDTFPGEVPCSAHHEASVILDVLNVNNFTFYQD